MEKTKEYKIVINGVDVALNQLNALEDILISMGEKIDSLSEKTLSVKAETNVTQETVNNEPLKEKNTLLTQILANDTKILQAEEEEYKTIIRQKQELKEKQQLAKAQVAQENLQTKQYANSMQGLKQKLNDIKTVLNSMPLDNPQFKNLSEEALTITNRLKELEKAYGTFGRNVGNYGQVAEDLKKFEIEVNGVTRSFGSAQEAARQLKRELGGMDQNTKEFKNLSEIVAKLDSHLDDLGRSSQFMDNVLDTMTSITSIASAGKGFAAFFGLDGTAIDKSLKSLLALQTALKGLETLQMQLKADDAGFLGGLFKKGSEGIDKYVAGITNATVTTNGLTKATKVGTVAVKGFSLALKGIATGGIMIAIDLLMTGISKLGKMLTDWWNRDKDLIDVNKQLSTQLKISTERTKERIDAINLAYLRGYINEEQRENKILEEQNKLIEEQIKLRRSAIELENDEYLKGGIEENVTSRWFSPTKTIDISGYNLPMQITNLDELEQAWNEVNEAMQENVDIYTHLQNKAESGYEKLNYWFKSLGTTLDKNNVALAQFEKTLLGEFVNRYEEIVKKYRGNTTLMRNELLKLYEDFNSRDITNSALAHLDDIIKTDAAREQIRAMIQSLKELKDYSDNLRLDNLRQEIALLETPSGYKRDKASLEQQKKREIAESKSREERLLIEKKYEALMKDLEDKHNKEMLDKAKQYQQKLLQAERDAANMRIDIMEDSFSKRYAQMRNEFENKVKDIKLSKILVDERTVLAEKQYLNQLRQEYDKFAKDIEKAQKEISDNILKHETENIGRQLDNVTEHFGLIRERIENTVKYEQDMQNMLLSVESKGSFRMKDYFSLTDGTVDGKALKKMEELVELRKEEVTLMQQIKPYKEFYEQLRNAQQEYDDAVAEGDESLIESTKARLEEAQKMFKDVMKGTSKDYEEIIAMTEDRLAVINEKIINTNNELVDRIDKNMLSYTKARPNRYGDYNPQEYIDSIMEQFDVNSNLFDKISEQFELIYMTAEQYAEKNVRLAEVEANQLKKIQNDSEQARYDEQVRANEKYRDEQDKSNDDLYKSQTDFYEVEKKMHQDALASMNLTKEEYEQERNRIEKEYEDKQLQVYHEFINNRDAIYRAFVERKNALVEEHNYNIERIEIDSLKKVQEANKKAMDDKVKVITDGNNAIALLEKKQPKMNGFGINMVQTYRDNKELLGMYEAQKKAIKKQISDIKQLMDRHEMNADDANNSLEQLGIQIEGLNDKIRKVKGEMSLGGMIGQFFESYGKYIGQAIQSIQTVSDALYDLENYQLEREMDAIDKQNEMLDKKLQEREELIQKYSENVNSIEDELQTARGDRRQYLIDALNNEIRAQREELAEKKRIEREKEALEKRQEILEKKQRELQYEQNLRQILLSGALAITNAFATQPFIPVGLAMGALATTLTAAQYAIAKQQKPYEKGGQLDSGLVKGKRHSQGGVPVGNTGIEVEGEEFITNRKTTLQNIDLLTFINSKRKRLDINDFVEFYAGKKVRVPAISKTRFAEGGMIPNVDLSALNERTIIVRDDATYQVSVVDINNKQDEVKQVQVLAGIAS